MKIKQSSKSSLFLIELIIAIFFFIIAATICIQLFVKSHTISNNTVSLNQSVLWTQNLAEIFTSQNGDYMFLKEVYSDKDCITETAFSPKQHLLLLFRADWTVTTNITDASYCVLSSYSEDTDFHYQDIYVMELDITTLALDDISSLIMNNSLISHQQIKQFIPYTK
ncbi:MAG: hypothetical protein E7290_11485 [Lachnospiraceae bacterium]|nr:hypothetical protein [Lachnospiraceae bacterium]